MLAAAAMIRRLAFTAPWPAPPRRAAAHGALGLPGATHREGRVHRRGECKVASSRSDVIQAAAEATVARLAGADPVVIGVARAGDVVPGLERDVLLHAGPPLTGGKYVGPMLGALTGALRYEGLARSDEEACRLLTGGQVR